MKCIVIGAGATGLAAAYLLRRSGADVTVVEAAPRAGGLLATFDVGDGHQLEHFYHHFFTHDAEINWLLSELGLRDRVVFLPTTMGMFRGERVYDFNGPKDLLNFSAMSVASRLRFGASSALLAYRAAYAEEEHRAALDWFRRWAGASATASIWEPLLRSKFGDAAERIPLAWMAGRLRQRARSRQGTEERLGYLQGSLQVLVDRLLEVLAEQGVEVLLGTPTEAFLYTDGRIAGVRTPRGTLQADMVLSTIATPHLSALVQDIAPDYARELSRIEYLGALCTVLSLTERLSPVYWLNVADAGYDFGGVIEQTNFIPAAAYGGQHIVYLSRYLPVTHPLWGMDDDLLLERQLDQLGTMFRRDVRPLMRKHWIFRGRFAAPLPDRGFAERIPKLRSPLRDLYVASMAHVYPDERSVNNSIRVAAEVVRIMGMDGDLVPRGMSLAGKYGT